MEMESNYKIETAFEQIFKTKESLAKEKCSAKLILFDHYSMQITIVQFHVSFDCFQIYMGNIPDKNVIDHCKSFVKSKVKSAICMVL